MKVKINTIKNAQRNFSFFFFYLLTMLSFDILKIVTKTGKWEEKRFHQAIK